MDLRIDFSSKTLLLIFCCVTFFTLFPLYNHEAIQSFEDKTRNGLRTAFGSKMCVKLAYIIRSTLSQYHALLTKKCYDFEGCLGPTQV